MVAGGDRARDCRVKVAAQEKRCKKIKCDSGTIAREARLEARNHFRRTLDPCRYVVDNSGVVAHTFFPRPMAGSTLHPVSVVRRS